MVSNRDSWSFGGIYDHIQKPQDVAVFDKPVKLFFQNVVIDTVKILSNIAFQDPAVRPVLSVVPRHKIFQAVKSEVRSFAFLACVVVVYESFRKVCVADGLFCREIDGLFCRSSPDIIVRRRCVLSHKRRGWLQPSPSFRYSRNLALQDELYHPVINNGPAVLVCVDKRLGTGPVNQSRDAG